MNSAVVELVFSKLNCAEALTKRYIEIALSDIALFDRKQHDYGSENIAAFGERGVVVRMTDKMARLRNLVWGDKLASNEAVENSYADMSVYGVIARMCVAGAWPGINYYKTPRVDTGAAPPPPPEPDRWEDTPPDVAYPQPYWCPVCGAYRMYSWRVDGAHCDGCGKFLFGPGTGGARNC